MPAATAQLNVRVDAELKRGGEAVLARYGLTPSDAVRGLWSYVVAHQAPPAFLSEKEPAEVPWSDDGCGLALAFLGTQPPRTAQADMPWSEERDALYDELLDRMEARCH